MRLKSILILIAFLVSLTGCEMMHDIFFGDGDDDDSSLDQDGIPDQYEAPGMLYNGLPLYDWGARPDHPDLFVHVSTMVAPDTSDGGILLQKSALDKVVAAFDKEGIAVHFDVGTVGLYEGTTPVSSGRYNLGNANYQVPYNASIYIAASELEESADENLYVFVDVLKDDNRYFPSERGAIFYYMVFGSSQNQDGSGGSSGLSWIGGTEFLVTLSGWGLKFDNIRNTNKTINYQASTIMHEFGHSLGLRHGGYEDQNYKPNYFSIMNYLYQLYGLPHVGTSEGDRYYVANGLNGYTDYSQLQYSPDSSQFLMDYSHGRGGDLNEHSLDERYGLRQSGSSGVDWNGNGNSNDSNISLDINAANPDYNAGYTTLRDYNDWGNLFFYYEAIRSRSAADLLQDRELAVENLLPF